MAKEANTEGPTNEQHLHDDQNYKKTTITKLPTDFVETPRPTIQRVSVEWPRRPAPMGLRMNSAYMTIKTV